MTKKIEIPDSLANYNIINLLYQFTNANSEIPSGSCKIYLMSGEVPIDENGFYPKNFNIALPAAGMYWPPNWEFMPYVLTGFTPGTYTATVTEAGQTITASVDATETEVTNFQILSRSGNSGCAIQSISFPFEIPTNATGDGGPTSGLTLGLNASAVPNSMAGTNLVMWKNNRIKANNNAEESDPATSVWLSTYAAAATASGTATWFYGTNTNSSQWFVGTVGLTGSGADLELDDVNIVQGKTYGINNLRIQMPTSFTY